LTEGQAQAVLPQSLQALSPRLHHVGIVILDRESSDEFLGLLGQTVERRYYVEQYRAWCLFTSTESACLELVIPDGPESPLARHNSGIGGLHHIAMEVDDLREATEVLAANDVQLLEPTPVVAGPIAINFVPPAFTRGITVELIESLS